jgi:galactitol-specific phosphotransferase system IIB component
MRFFIALCFNFLLIISAVVPSSAADRNAIETFMKVTGFDVSLESMRVSASDAPAMLGLDAADFGVSWKRIADELFEPESLKNDAVGILQQALSENVLVHASEFYASELGIRLVKAENLSHFEDSDQKKIDGELILAELVDRSSPQPQYFREMADSIGALESGIRSFREVQVRFIMAAMGAGLIDRQIDEADLRSMLAQQDAEIKTNMLQSLIIANSYTYRSFTDLEIAQYRDALATDEMKEVYELMNAIHFALMADRYEQMALKMVKLHPLQEL